MEGLYRARLGRRTQNALPTQVAPKYALHPYHPRILKEQMEARRRAGLSADTFTQHCRKLWRHKPLRGFCGDAADKNRGDKSLNIRREVNGFEFAPLVCAKTALVAELTSRSFRRRLRERWWEAEGTSTTESKRFSTRSCPG